MVEAKNLHEWKEILAYCVTYSADGGRQLAMELGNELLTKRNDTDSALICFIVAYAFEETVKLWNIKLKSEMKKAHYKEHPNLIRRTLEKVLAFKRITKSNEGSAIFDTLILYC